MAQAQCQCQCLGQGQLAICIVQKTHGVEKAKGRISIACVEISPKLPAFLTAASPGEICASLSSFSTGTTRL